MYSTHLKTNFLRASPTHAKVAAKRHPRVVMCNATENNEKSSVKTTINNVVEKRKEVDRIRIDRIKEIGSSIDHIAKSEVKQTVEIMVEIMPFIKKIKGVEKFIDKKDSTTTDLIKKE